jgi:hypothetical protein
MFGTCYKIDQLPFWSVGSVLPCMYVMLWIWTINLFILEMFPTIVGNSWELEDYPVYISSRWLIRPIYFTMKLIVYDSWAQSWARLLFLESRILHRDSYSTVHRSPLILRYDFQQQVYFQNDPSQQPSSPSQKEFKLMTSSQRYARCNGLTMNYADHRSDGN